MSHFEGRDQTSNYRIYQFQLSNNRITRITPCIKNNEIYEKGKNGFYRRVNVSKFLNNGGPVHGQLFQDEFRIDFNNNKQNPHEQYTCRALWQVKQKQQQIFRDFTFEKQSFIDYQHNYATFAAQFGLIDKVHLQTIFLTRNINRQGYYEYFVRRDGQYYLDHIDDKIPVKKANFQPIWGLSYACPWELLLMKAWIKQKGSMRAVLQAQPFEFLYAFGLPGYSKKNYLRQLDYLNKQKSKEQVKIQKLRKLPLNYDLFNLLGKTHNDDRISELGLVKNCLGYKIHPINPTNTSRLGKQTSEQTIYKIHSTVPSKWVGSKSIVRRQYNFNIKGKIYDFQKNRFNLQKQFLATQSQVLSIFSKFYVAPNYKDQYRDGNVYQDSYFVDNASMEQPMVFNLRMIENGNFNINIQHKDYSKRIENVRGHDQTRWPYIKYFLARLNKDGSAIKSKIATQKGLPGDLQPNLFRYQYFDIDFMKGYHRSVNRFMQIQKGDYRLYVKMQGRKGPYIKRQKEQTIDYVISTNSSAKFQQLTVNEMDPYQLRELVDSTIFDYAKLHGQRYVRDHMQFIYFGNCFKQIGFGFLALQIKQPQAGSQSKSRSKLSQSNADNQLGIRIIPQKLRKLKLAAYYYLEKDGNRSRLQQNQNPITMISSKGFPKIIVFENPQYDYLLTQQFPEPGAVEVYSMRQKR